MTIQTLFCRKRAALLLSLAFHGLLVGGIIYFTSTDTPPRDDPQEELKAMQMFSCRFHVSPPPKPIETPPPPKLEPIKKIEPKPKPKPKPKKIEPKLTVPLKKIEEIEEPKVIEEVKTKEPQIVEEQQPSPQVIQTTSSPLLTEATPPQKTPQEQEKEYGEVNFSSIRDMAVKNLIYPRVAKKMGWGGVVEIKLIVGVDGKLLSASIFKSSGREVLDNSALKAVLALKNKDLPKPQTQSEIILPFSFMMR